MRFGGRRLSALLVAAGVCLALALASLALPSGPTYDSYAWLIWGRDLAHLQLSTANTGTSWKPLPALVDALLTPLGGAATSGWLVIARAGAMFAVFMAFRLAWRLAPRGRGRWLAGIAAAVLLTLTHDWVNRNAVGDAEGLMTALGLLAFDRHLDGRRGGAFASSVVAGLIRVEAWPFVLAYGAWLWWQRGVRRTWVALGVLVLPVLWFGGDLIGSGNLTTGSDRALRPIPGTPGASAHPALAVLQQAYQMLPWPTWIGLGVMLAAALAARRGRSTESGAVPARARALAALAVIGVIWTAIVAIMAQRGYAGLPRFLFMADGCAAVVAGVGLVRSADLLAQIVPGPGNGTRARAVLASATAVLVAALFVYGSLPNASLIPGDLAAVDQIADMDTGLTNAVEAAGGPAGVLRCGYPTTTWYGVTALAWDLDVRPAPASIPLRHSAHPEDFAPVSDSGRWHVLGRRCAQRSQARAHSRA